MNRRIAFYGGSFDPMHRAHLAIGMELLERFALDQFVYIPAFRAPHKTRSKPTSAYDRYAMLCLATQNVPQLSVSRMEIEMPDRPFSVDTLARLNTEFAGDNIFFVIGADSWRDINTWREWETVLRAANIIVVTRPSVEIGSDHVTEEIRDRIIDLRGGGEYAPSDELRIYFTDAVNLDVSATDIRRRIRENDSSWQREVPAEVAKYLEKYQIYT
ncbi:MAG: nicotinate (nicotinamide) nucleotide adenylyltransferase [Chloracidobacterium sp.]|nr:nicotinate (nicotinamide) nucleotide adenylyltransferase [Chloracidobacterium sp.]